MKPTFELHWESSSFYHLPSFLTEIWIGMVEGNGDVQHNIVEWQQENAVFEISQLEFSIKIFYKVSALYKSICSYTAFGSSVEVAFSLNHSPFLLICQDIQNKPLRMYIFPFFLLSFPSKMGSLFLLYANLFHDFSTAVSC